MSFKHNLIIGKGYNQNEIQCIFLYPDNQRQRGMKYSKETNTIVLINKHNSLYENVWIDGILYYTGMGLKGDQSFTKDTNLRLTQSKDKGTKIYIFDIPDKLTPQNYVFRGEFELIPQPFFSEQPDKKGNTRKVCIFPLKPLDLSEEEILEFNQRMEALKRSNLTKLSPDKLQQKIKKHPPFPTKYKISVVYYTRNKLISEWTKRRAKGVCELCEQPAPFNTKDGVPFLETHHIKWLSKGGEDSIENTVAVCPNCHRKLHHTPSASDIEKLKQIDKLNLD